MRVRLHYLAAFSVLSLYGGQVCPFVESLSISKWVIQLLIIISGVYMIRTLRVKSIHSTIPYHNQIRRQLLEDICLFMAAGLITAVYNTIIYGFPFESGMKIVTGFAIFSFFIAVDASLERERDIAYQIKRSHKDIFMSDSFMPLTRKFSLVAVICAFSVFIVLFFLFSKDLDWLVQTKPEELTQAKSAIMLEIGFVTIVLLAHVFNLILTFSTNLKLFIENENQALMSVSNGNLDSWVPVSTTDEFGVMARYTNKMIHNLKERTEELLHTQDVTIYCLASLAETRDPETGGHIMRTQRYVRLLADYLKINHNHQDLLTDSVIELLFKSAPLHDIGKVGIPDDILLKPGKLTDDEFELMKKHTIFGRDAIKKAEDILGRQSFLTYASEIAFSHHEKWDGSGYPQGLQGEAIPLSARMMAIADVYDALISKRVYKPPFPHKKAVSIIQDGKGSHFDPEIVDAFLALENEFRKTAMEYADYEEERTLLSNTST